jgi:hypothetical protein
MAADRTDGRSGPGSRGITATGRPPGDEGILEYRAGRVVLPSVVEHQAIGRATGSLRRAAGAASLDADVVIVPGRAASQQACWCLRACPVAAFSGRTGKFTHFHASGCLGRCHRPVALGQDLPLQPQG